jgi:hypothetical protein
VSFIPSSNVPSPIVLRDVRTFGDLPNRSAIMEVVNDSNDAADPVIRFHFWDNAGRPQAVQSARLLAATCTTLHTTGVLWPHERMPCSTEVPPGAVTASYDVELDKDGIVLSGKRARTDLNVVGAELGSGRVKGWVENQKSSAICSPRVAVSLYDSSGRIVGWEADWVSPGRIEPGGRAPFQIPTDRAPTPVASFAAKAWTLDPIGSGCGG